MEFPRVRPPRGWFPIPEYLKRTAEKFPEKSAVRIRRKKKWFGYTYGELLEKVSRLAAFIKASGLGKGSKISVLGENRPEWVLCYFAVQWAGATVVPLDARLKPPEYLHILNDAEVEMVFVSGSKLADIQEIRDRVGSLKKVIVMDEVNGELVLDKVLEEYKEGIALAPLGLEDLAVILYTSGTTGTSKGVMLTHKNISSNVDAIYQIIYIDENDRSFSYLPLHHVFEATAGMIFPLSVGVSITLARSLKPTEMIEDLRDTRPTLMTTVPLLLEKFLLRIRSDLKKSSLKKGMVGLMKGLHRGMRPILGRDRARKIFRPILSKLGFDELRFLVSGGAALPRWVSQGLEELGFPILQGYGLSETAPVLTVNPPCCPRNASAGLPLPYVEIRIMDPDPEGIGEIAARGPNVMPGYYKNPKATAEVFTEDGWFLTGDVGYLDKDGFLYITGRKKSVIVTAGGKNIFPEEVEEVLLQSPFIEEVLVVRGANPVTGAEEVQAIVYPNFEEVDAYFRERGITNPTEEEIEKLIGEEINRYSAQLADYKKPKRFRLRDEEFPKTTTRKIKRYLFEEKSIPLMKEKKK